MGYSFRLAARVLLYAPSHRQDSIYHSLYYTSCGALAGTRHSSGSTMEDRSDDPSHHERMLLPQSYSFNSAWIHQLERTHSTHCCLMLLIRCLKRMAFHSVKRIWPISWGSAGGMGVWPRGEVTGTCRPTYLGGRGSIHSVKTKYYTFSLW